MKKLFLIGLCGLLLIPSTVFAEELEQPQVPEVLTEETVNNYNLEVDNYNNQIDAKYEEELNKYNEAIEHNQNEDTLVQENEQALTEYQKVEEQIKNFANKGITDNRITSAEEAPTSYETTTENPITIKVDKITEDSDIPYNVVNLHLYVDNYGKESNYYGTDIKDESFHISEEVLKDLVLLEWESTEVDANDIVTVVSESEAMGYRSAAFYRKLDGYTNGYWLPGSHEFASTCNYSYSTWSKGSAQEFSYIDGATDRHGVKNVFSLFTYTFYRLGVEPEKIEKYIPDYWDATEPIKGEYLNYLEYIPIEEEEEEEPIIPTEEVKPEEPIQEEEEEEEIPNEAPKTRTPVQTPQSVEPIPEAPAAAVTTTLVESVPVENSTPILEAVQDEPVVEIDTAPIPLSTPETSYWALINLICSIIVAIEAIILFIFFFIKRKVKEDKENTSIILTKSFVKRLVSIFIAVISFILFFLTEDMTLPMRYVDKYTILMILLIILQTVIMAFWKRNKSEQN